MYTHAYLYVTTYIVMHTSQLTANKSYGKGMENIGTRLLGRLTAGVDAFYLSVCTNKGKKLKNLIIQLNKKGYYGNVYCNAWIVVVTQCVSQFNFALVLCKWQDHKRVYCC